MKKISVVFAFLILISASMSFAVEFSDVSQGQYSDLYLEAFDTLVEKGAVNGYPDGSFKPGYFVTRAEFVKILLKAFSIEASTNSNEVSKFSDIKGTEWYAPYVIKATSLGIISGYEDNTFKPNEYVSYGELLSMVIRYLNINVRDVVKDEPWFAPYMEKSRETGLVRGFASNDFNGSYNARRDNTVLITYNAQLYSIDPSIISPKVIKPETEKTKEVDKEESIKEFDVSTLDDKKYYYGIITELRYSKGNDYIDIDSYDLGEISLKATSDDIKFEEGDIIVFKIKNNKTYLVKQFNPDDLDDEKYYLVTNVDEELISFDEANTSMDLEENSFMLDGTSTKYNKYKFYYVKAGFVDKTKYEFDSCKEVDYKDIHARKGDRFYFDKTQKICIIVNGILDEEWLF